jgi:hypothetical protein
MNGSTQSSCVFKVIVTWFQVDFGRLPKHHQETQYHDGTFHRSNHCFRACGQQQSLRFAVCHRKHGHKKTVRERGKLNFNLSKKIELMTRLP